MSKEILTTAERWRRFQRDQRIYRQRHLQRRLHPRFQRDLQITPHVFLAPGQTKTAPLQRTYDEVRQELRGRAVWTLDTAVRLVCGWGFLVACDLTGYLEPSTLEWTENQGLIQTPSEAEMCVDPLYRRPPLLIAHVTEQPPDSVELPSGDCVVDWDFLKRDILGTLGWRPDVLTRLEGTYPGNLTCNRSKHRPPPSAGAFDSGYENTAERAEELMAEAGFDEDSD